MIARMIVAIALVGVLAAPAAAATFTPAPNLTFDLKPSTKEGYFSAWTTSDLKGLNALRTRVVFAWFGKDPKWWPSYKIGFESANERVFFSVGARDGQKLRIRLEVWQEKVLMQTQDFKLDVDSRAPLDVEAYWTEDGVITVSAAPVDGKRERYRAKLTAPLKELGLSVSTAGVDFAPFQLGAGTP